MDFKPDYNLALSESFYQQATEIVAKNLIGKIMVKMDKDITLAGRIVETEAYLGSNDLASHSYPGVTKRNKPMFASGGILYVYLSYGIHNCTNIVTETENTGSAVLIRAVEPLLGADDMIANRGVCPINKLASGPGNFSKAFGFSLSDNYRRVGTQNLFIQDMKPDNLEIVTAKRIGISRSEDLQLRFYLKNSRFVSKK
jgi:DNA-3-methyladenine glycosylase